MEFFLDGGSIMYWKHILNTFVKKIIYVKKTYTNERKLFNYLSLCGFSKDASYQIIEKDLYYKHLCDYFKQQYFISFHIYGTAVNSKLNVLDVLSYCLCDYKNGVLYYCCGG